MVGGDRSFKLTLKEEDEEFSDELREDCEVRGEGEGGKGIMIHEVVFNPSAIYCIKGVSDGIIRFARHSVYTAILTTV